MNLSVLLEGLEYLQTVFSVLIEEKYDVFGNKAPSYAVKVYGGVEV
jgi:hypothetical protein